MEQPHSPSRALSGKVAVVTGSSQGIGAAIARKFGECGARVVILGIERHREGGENVVAAVKAAGSEAFLVIGDLKEETHCRDVIRQAIERFGRIDILVNNAALTYRNTVEDSSVALWDEIFAVNLRAPFILCQEAVKDMKERRSGCIINIGSLNAYVGATNLLAYSSSKGGLLTFTKNLANYLTRYRIRVNQINPGWTLTEGERYVKSVSEGRGERWLEDAFKTRPLGRLLTPEEISRAALFLATDEIITGAVLDYEQAVTGAPPIV